MIASTAYLSIQPTQRIAQGSDWSSAVAVKQADGTAQDLTAYSVDFVAEVYGRAVSGAVNKTNTVGGLITISLTDAQTSDLFAPAMGVGQLWAETGTTRILMMTFPIFTVPEVKP